MFLVLHIVKKIHDEFDLTINWAIGIFAYNIKNGKSKNH
jgi:hypothetical protein